MASLFANPYPLLVPELPPGIMRAWWLAAGGQELLDAGAL